RSRLQALDKSQMHCSELVGSIVEICKHLKSNSIVLIFFERFAFHNVEANLFEISKKVRKSTLFTLK
ncbi:MAG: hypothetical protein ACPICB_04830, partial [Candidatus Poseidoniaceae archaeon]